MALEINACSIIDNTMKCSKESGETLVMHYNEREQWKAVGDYGD